MKRFTVRQSAVPEWAWEVWDAATQEACLPRYSDEQLGMAEQMARILNTNAALDRMADQERTEMELYLLRHGWTRMEQRGWWIYTDNFGSFCGTLDWCYEHQQQWETAADAEEIRKIQ